MRLRWTPLAVAFAAGLLACAWSWPAPEEPDPWPRILREYERYLAYKALAIDDGGSYGYSYGVASPEQAVAQALEYCERYSDEEPSSCRVWLLGQRVVEPLSPQRLAEEMRLYSLRVVDGYDRDLLFDDPSRQVPLIRDYFGHYFEDVEPD